MIIVTELFIICIRFHSGRYIVDTNNSYNGFIVATLKFSQDRFLSEFLV